MDLHHLMKWQELVKEDLIIEKAILDNVVPDSESDDEAVPDAPLTPPKPVQFSSLTDPHGFNARVLSKQTIDRTNWTDFQRRKALQEGKMRSHTAKIWKMDWHYKLPKKVKVYEKKGKSFAPYKSALSVQQEDALTIFWKFYPGAESIGMAERDLRLLKQRHLLLGADKDDPKMCYFDNCCNVRNKLQSILGAHVLVKCDVFHWGTRWNVILFDLKSKKTSIFRQLMRRALYVMEDEEINRARDVLQQKKKNHTQREVMKMAKGTIPPPDILEQRVMSVIHALMEKDLLDDKKRMADPTLKPDRFFKAGAETLNVIVNQMEHVKKDCLSDPPSDVVQIHRFNAKNKKTYTARSTGTNEVDNLQLHKLLDTPSIGLTRADRLINDYYERSNENKLVNRMGKEPEATSRTGHLQMLQGLADQCGFSDFPIKKPSYPVNLDSLEERLGFDYHVPDAFREHGIVDKAVDDDSDDDHDLANFITGIDFGEDSDADIDVPVEGAPENGASEDVDSRDQEDDLSPIYVFGREKNVDLSVFVLTILEHERTYDTFVRKTQQAPWVPFKLPKEAATFTALDKAEMKLFEEMEGSYDRNATRLDSTKGYKTFVKAWELQLANTLRASLDGEDVQVIHRKSYLQLQQHYDDVQRHNELLLLNSKEDPQLREVEKVFRSTRKEMTPHQSAITCNPDVQYNRQHGRVQFGVPMALNTHIVANVFFVNGATAAVPITYRASTPQRPSITRSSLGKEFRYNKYCWRCGFQKKIHNRAGNSFGDMC